MKFDKIVVSLTALSLVAIIVAGLVVLFVQERDEAKRASEIKPTNAPTPTPDKSLLHVENEASKYCVDQGGTLKVEKNRQGKEYGVCVFPPKDNVEGMCEEWALFNKKCPKGGYRIKSQVSDVVRFCIISGGEFQDGGIDDQGNQKGKCYFYPKTQCDMNDFFSGTCKPPEINK